ncbi:MAG TPA: putative ABC exporter domain-containing protein, partial [Candidatus Acidoferrum sp.]|nr:putative ABC exporter domain-containing protein [Candidatus Acidoferrum sp.]
MGVANALLYLRFTQIRNKVVSFVRQLRRPRYLLGLAFTLGYLSLMLLVRHAPKKPVTAPMIEFFEFMLSFMASALLCVGWLFPGDSPGLQFSQAEAAFLFPAPISRRQLIHYKLLSAIFGGLLGSCLMTLFMTLPNPDADVRSMSSLWLAFWSGNTLYIFHCMGAALMQQRMVERGKAKGWRIGVKVLVATLVLAGVGLVFAGGFDTLKLLMPGRLLVHAVFVNGVDYLLWLLLLWALLALHYWWVLGLETPFEESALAQAARRAALMAGKRVHEPRTSRAQRESFSLRPGLPVELVLLWKNLLKLPGYLNRHVFVVSLLALVFIMLLLPRLGGDGGRFIVQELGE